MTDIFNIAQGDKSLIFKDFPLIDFKRKNDIEWSEKHALISAIGFKEDAQGLSIGTDSFEISFDIEDFEVNKLPQPGDSIRYMNGDGVVIELIISLIARDKQKVSLGIWLCWAADVAAEGLAGQINREIR